MQALIGIPDIRPVDGIKNCSGFGLCHVLGHLSMTVFSIQKLEYFSEVAYRLSFVSRSISSPIVCFL